MKWYAKLILIALLCYAFLANYKLVDGLSLVESPTITNKQLCENFLKNVRIEEIYYYETNFGDKYTIVLKLSNSRDIVTCGSEKDLDMFKIAGVGAIVLGAPELFPKYINPLPLWFYFIVFLAIAFFPNLQKRRERKEIAATNESINKKINDYNTKQLAVLTTKLQSDITSGNYADTVLKTKRRLMTEMRLLLKKRQEKAENKDEQIFENYNAAVYTNEKEENELFIKEIENLNKYLENYKF